MGKLFTHNRSAFVRGLAAGLVVLSAAFLATVWPGHAGDTDLDGWDDSVDLVPTSRVAVLWGDARFTTGDCYTYVGPAWWKDRQAFKTGGEWNTNTPCWHVAAAETNMAEVYIPLDRALLSNDVVMKVSFFDHANASLLIDLLDTNLTEVVSGLGGNLLAGSGGLRTLTMNLPLATNPTAAVVCLSRGYGEVSLHMTSLYIDLDGDGLDADQESQLGISDTVRDSDGDGMEDGDEARWGLNPAVADSFFRLDPASGLTSWNTGFETSEGYASGALNGQNGWTASAGVNVVASQNHGGAQSVSIPGTLASNGPALEAAGHVAAAGRTNVWASFWWKSGQGRPADPAGVKAAAVVCMDNARLLAWDGLKAGWVASERQFPKNAAGWWRLDLGFDYAAKTYCGYVNGVLALENVPFKDADLAALSRFSVRGACSASPRDAFLDDVRLDLAPPADLDDDGDGLSNVQEAALGTNPRNLDTDGDGLPDAWEAAHSTNPLVNDANADPDLDLLSNFWEYQKGTDPQESDSDGDNLTDWYECAVSQTDPLATDTDSDGMDDWWEVRFGLDPLTVTGANLDPDGDTLTNAWECVQRCNPVNADTDGDGLPDAWELAHGLNPVAGESVSLVSWWRFDEGSGSVAGDDNRMWRNDARLMGTAGRAGQGHAGGALQLDGSGYALVSNHLSLASGSGLALALWVRPDSFATPADPVYLAAKGNTAGATEYALSYVASSGSLRFSHKNAAGQSEAVSAVCNLPLASWSHVAVSVNGSAVTFFTNGASCGVAQSLVHTRSLAGDLAIGSTLDPAAAHPGFAGRLDDVRVYNAALPGASIAEFMEGEADPDGDGLSNRLEFQRGTDPQANDASLDSDGDGLSNAAEILVHGTNPFAQDTDGDGAGDGVEVAAGTNPLVADWGTSGGPAVTVISPANGAIILW